MTLGEQIRAAREEKNLSQEELAEALGVSRQAVSKWENNTAVPQGANRNLLAEVLGLELVKEEAPSGKHRAIAWIGWILAAVLLLALIVLLVNQRFGPEASAGEPSESAVEDPAPEPALRSIRFYDEDQKEVVSENTEFGEYNAAEIDSILIQWTGNVPLRTVKMYFASSGADIVQTELLDVSIPADAGNAWLLSADALHRDDLEGYLYFELQFDGGETITTYDPYKMDYVFFDGSAAALAYIEGFDGAQLAFDEVEWINIPSERAQELGVMDQGSGFYIYNESEKVERLPVADACVYTVLNWSENFVPMTVSASEFRALLEERGDSRTPYHLTVEEDQIIAVQEQYVP